MSNRAFLIPLLATALLACSDSSRSADAAPQDSRVPDLQAADRQPPVDAALADGARPDAAAADGSADQGPTCRPWTLETIDNVVALDTSIAVEQSGVVHVSYSDSGGGDNLKYAKRAMSGSWAKHTVDSDGKLAGENEIAVDSDGVHIVYTDFTNLKLKYAYRAGTSIGWSKSFIDSSNGSLMNPSLIADGKGTLHVIYHGTDSSRLKYAFRSGGAGSWIASSIVDTHAVGPGCGLAIDAAGVPHISFFGPDENLWYAVRPAVGSIANVSLVDGDGYTGTVNAIAVDGNGKIAISYVNGTLKKLKVASRAKAASSWTLDTVDAASQAWLIGSTDIAIDAAGGLHVSYVDVLGSYELRYAHLAPGGSTWAVETVDADGKNGLASSIVVDAAQDVHISYYAEASQTVKYARRHPCP